MTVVAFGELLLRLKAPGAGRLLQEGSLDASFGGAEFNVLALLSRLQLPTEYVTVLPRNAIGDAALGEIRRQGVGTRYLQRSDGRMGLYFLEGGAGLRSARVEYDRAASSFAQLQPANFDWPGILAGGGWLHLTGITAALGTGPVAAMTAAARAAHSLGIPVSLDVNWRQQLWRDASRRPFELLAPIVDSCRVVFAGVHEWQVCLGDDRCDDADAERGFPAFAGRLLERHAHLQSVVSTLRSSRSAEDQTLGAICLDRATGATRASSLHIPHTVDRIGTGDAFVAGCLFGVRAGWTWQRTLEFAVAAAALKHSIPGDVALISREEIEALMAGDAIGRVVR